MTNWNRAYLDALEVPVWVPLSVHKKDKAVQTKVEPGADAAVLSPEATESSASESSVTESKSEVNNEVVALAFVQGDQQADFIFVVSKDADKSQAQATLKKLELAWRLWLEQPFSAAIAQVSEPSDSTTSIEECRGKVIACDLSDSLEHPSIPAPHLDFFLSNKKDWWSLLQRLQ